MDKITLMLSRETVAGEEYEVEVEVEYSVEPDEYEGGYLFHRGGVDIDSTRIDGQEVTLSESESRWVEEKVRESVDVPATYYRGIR